MRAPFKKLNNYPIQKHLAKDIVLSNGIIYNDLCRKYYTIIKGWDKLIIDAGSHSLKKEWRTFHIEYFDSIEGNWYKAFRKPEVKPKIKKCKLCKEKLSFISKDTPFCGKCRFKRTFETDTFMLRRYEKRAQAIKKHLMIFTEFHKGYELYGKENKCVICMVNDSHEIYFCCEKCLIDKSKKQSINKFISIRNNRKHELNILLEKESKSKDEYKQEKQKEFSSEDLKNENKVMIIDANSKEVNDFFSAMKNPIVKPFESGIGYNALLKEDKKNTVTIEKDEYKSPRINIKDNTKELEKNRFFKIEFGDKRYRLIDINMLPEFDNIEKTIDMFGSKPHVLLKEEVFKRFEDWLKSYGIEEF